MWLLTLVLAFSASLSACEGPGECPNTMKSWNASSGIVLEVECLDKFSSGSAIDSSNLCECRGIPRNSTALEIECLEGVPLVDTLPHNVWKLVVQSVDEYQVVNMLRELENSSLECLSELVIKNSIVSGSNGTWLQFPLLVTLNVSNTNLEDVSDLRICNSSELRVLDLSANQLRDLPPEGFRTLTGLVRLSLRNNGIESVDEDAFIGLVVLEDLDIADNKLELLPDNVLSHLASLQTLNLSGNQLKILGATWFEALGRLRELDVSRNGLTKAASGVLQPLPGLSVLRLAENPLMERDVSLLLGTGRRLETVDASRTGLDRVPAALTRSVRALRLAGNKLTCIRDGDFDGYPLLRILDLSDNLLNDVEDDALGRLETLEHLDLAGNRLKFVPQSLPNSLIRLDLRRNIIEALALNDLTGIDKLRKLLLNDNSIERIEEGALSQLPLLTHLDISNNPIKQLLANALAGPGNLVALRMSSLRSLEWEHERRGDMTFPVPTPDRLVSLDLSHSPVLADQLLADNATLAACKSLLELNLINTSLASIRFDIVYLLPQLQLLGLSENDWNCTSDMLWLGEWIRQHGETSPIAQCHSTSNFPNISLVDLPAPPIISTSSVRSTISDFSYHPENVNYAEFRLPNTSSDSNTTSIVDPMSLEVVSSTNILNEIQLNNTRTNKSLSSESNGMAGIFQSAFYNPKHMAEFNNKLKPQRLRSNEKLIKPIRINEDKFINDDEKNERLHEILDNRVDSIERDQFSWVKPPRGTVSTQGTQESSEFRSSNRITWESADSSVAPQMGNLEPTKGMKKIQNIALANDIAKTIAEELNGHSREPNVQPVSGIATHPGMLVLIGAIIGAAAALTVVLSRRVTLRRHDSYQRHENIEVHTLMPTTELW